MIALSTPVVGAVAVVVVFFLHFPRVTAVGALAAGVSMLFSGWLSLDSLQEDEDS